MSIRGGGSALLKVDLFYAYECQFISDLNENVQ